MDKKWEPLDWFVMLVAVAMLLLCIPASAMLFVATYKSAFNDLPIQRSQTESEIVIRQPEAEKR